MVELDSSTLYEISPTPLTALLEKLQNVYHNVRHELLTKILYVNILSYLM